MAKKPQKSNNAHVPSSHRFGIAAVLILVLSTALYLGGNFTNFLKTSVIGYPEHAPFDGTVAPVKDVPDWVMVDYNKETDNYSSFQSNQFIDLPEYDPNQLKTSTDSLVWGDDADDAIRNAKLTYSVAYLGNYLLDGVEGGGSHPAVDIRVPRGTPIFSIANGTVIKVSNQTSGFGYHIVIQHNNFPTLENSSAKETIYSSYSHLGSILISEGDVVAKGEQIALSGESGTATTPHLHFQIDNDDAPWHPFWPFTWAEISELGLDFFSAINEGFAQDKAAATTINPMKYVQTYSDGSSNYVTTDTESYVSNPEEENVVVEEPVLDPPILNFEFVVRENYFVGQSSDFKVLLRDQYGNIYEEGFGGEVVIKAATGTVTPRTPIVTVFQFDSNREFETSFQRMSEGKDRLVIEYDGEKYFSDTFEVLDPNGTQSEFSDLSIDSKYYGAVSYLAGENVVVGYPDGTFKPETAVSRVEALKFIYEGINENIINGEVPFPDVSKNEWYGSYLFTAYDNGVVDGYPDGTFKPINDVNKAEFYKLLFTGMGVDINPNVARAPFNDVSVDEWFAPYVSYAKDIGIIDSDVTQLNASVGMTRGEVAYAIYNLMKIMK